MHHDYNSTDSQIFRDHLIYINKAFLTTHMETKSSSNCDHAPVSYYGETLK